MALIRFRARVVRMWTEQASSGELIACACGYRSPTFGTQSDLERTKRIHGNLCSGEIKPALIQTRNIRSDVTVFFMDAPPDASHTYGWEISSHHFGGRSAGRTGIS